MSGSRVLGQVISGSFGKIVARQKHGEPLEIGQLVISGEEQKVLLQVYDLIYGSQLSQQHLELISGLRMEENSDLEFFDEEIRSYNLALLKTLLVLGKDAHANKSLPPLFANLREVMPEDMKFITVPQNPLFLGRLRSGSRALDINVFVDGEKALSHHVLIAAQTGKGKSNLTATMIWDAAKHDYCGILVLDPHDEYYGRGRPGLKEHGSKKVSYFTPRNPPPGARTLKISVRSIRPSHFQGAVSFSEAQQEALYAYYKAYREEWVEAIAFEKKLENFQEGTLGVVRRKVLSTLDLQVKGENSSRKLECNGAFDTSAGLSTVSDIVKELEQARVVIMDTSTFSGSSEILVGSMIASEVLRRYTHYRSTGEEKPVIAIVLEEAPRVLGRDVLERGENIFSTIAREGRKFRVGLVAITQLPSLIPKEILANMNTKIVLGMEMASERQALIESAAQDLSEDSRSIASLDKGEAIVTSTFTKFAIPVRIPLFEEFRKGQ